PGPSPPSPSVNLRDCVNTRYCLSRCAVKHRPNCGDGSFHLQGERSRSLARRFGLDAGDLRADLLAFLQRMAFAAREFDRQLVAELNLRSAPKYAAVFFAKRHRIAARHHLQRAHRVQARFESVKPALLVGRSAALDLGQTRGVAEQAAVLLLNSVQ